jgi:hypothetical protein
MFSTPTMIRHLGSALRGRRIQPYCGRVVFKKCPRSCPCMEALEDRRLLSYTTTNLRSLGGTASSLTA